MAEARYSTLYWGKVPVNIVWDQDTNTEGLYLDFGDPISLYYDPPITPGHYVDSQGDAWFLSPEGLWYDKFATAAGERYHYLLTGTGLTLREDEPVKDDVDRFKEGSLNFYTGKIAGQEATGFAEVKPSLWERLWKRG